MVEAEQQERKQRCTALSEASVCIDCCNPSGQVLNMMGGRCQRAWLKGGKSNWGHQSKSPITCHPDNTNHGSPPLPPRSPLQLLGGRCYSSWSPVSAEILMCSLPPIPRSRDQCHPPFTPTPPFPPSLPADLISSFTERTDIMRRKISTSYLLSLICTYVFFKLSTYCVPGTVLDADVE